MTTLMPGQTNPEGAQHPVTLRLPGMNEEFAVADLVVTSVERDLDAIQCAGHIVGYVQRAGRVFVSLIGERADRAEGCAQSLDWNAAAARLSSYCAHP